MASNPKFNYESQVDLMRAAARLYEAEMYEVCVGLLNILIACDYVDAHVLIGHCISELKPELGRDVPNSHYKIACEMGSAVGCYNLYLNLSEAHDDQAAAYLAKATELGWEE